MDPLIPPSRRDFLKGSLATGVTLAAAGAWAQDAKDAGAARQNAEQEEEEDKQQEKAKPPPPNHKDIRLAFIGTGGMGGAHVQEMVPFNVTVPCFCDVDIEHFARAFKHFPRARAYQDYRAMFDNESRNFDAVMIGTPDHHHYPATAIAMQLGKHVYTQKPLTHTVWEARQLKEMAARNPKLVTQMGNQGHALEGWRLCVEWYQSGALGDIIEVHSWTDRPIWPQGMDRPEGEDEVPAGLNWDVWIGPAKMRPYKNKVYAPFNWRGWWDFGAGALGDMACHTMDGLFWMLDPDPPTVVEPLTFTPVNNESFPKASAIRWNFPSKGGKPAFTAFWYDGGLMPTFPLELEFSRNLGRSGNLFVGTKASLLVQGDYGESPRIFPESKMKQIGKPPKLIERNPGGHYQEWLDAIAAGKPEACLSKFAYAGPMSEAILLGNVALRVKRRCEWDGANLKVTNLPEANEYVSKEYREGWKY